jgi:protein SCO1
MMRKALLLLLVLFPLGALAQSEAAAAKYFHGLALVDQNGRAVDLYDDVMKGHTVVINSFFASCQASCSVMAGTYQHLQTRFAARVGKDVRLVSITVDPAHDTPAALKAYAARMKAADGWLFLTGSKEQVDVALTKLGLAVGAREDHLNLMLVGNLKTGLWKKVFGLAKPEEIETAVRSVIEDKGAA